MCNHIIFKKATEKLIEEALYNFIIKLCILKALLKMQETNEKVKQAFDFYYTF